MIGPSSGDGFARFVCGRHFRSHRRDHASHSRQRCRCQQRRRRGNKRQTLDLLPGVHELGLQTAVEKKLYTYNRRLTFSVSTVLVDTSRKPVDEKQTVHRLSPPRPFILGARQRPAETGGSLRSANHTIWTHLPRKVRHHACSGAMPKCACVDCAQVTVGWCRKGGPYVVTPSPCVEPGL